MFGDFDINALMQQAQQLQDDLARAQAELAEKTFTASAGGGLVTLALTGAGDIERLDITPEAWDPEDPETLSALIIAAFRAAKSEADAATAAAMPDLPSMPPMPGLGG